MTRRDDDDDDETGTWFYCGAPDWGLAGFTTAVHRHSTLPSSSSSSLSSSASGFTLDMEFVTSGTSDTCVKYFLAWVKFSRINAKNNPTF